MTPLTRALANLAETLTEDAQVLFDAIDYISALEQSVEIANKKVEWYRSRTVWKTQEGQFIQGDKGETAIFDIVTAKELNEVFYV
jgi:hypothetical protein